MSLWSFKVGLSISIKNVSNLLGHALRFSTRIYVKGTSICVWLIQKSLSLLHVRPILPQRFFSFPQRTFSHNYIPLCKSDYVYAKFYLKEKRDLILDVLQEYEKVMTFLVNESNLLMYFCMCNSFFGQ